MVLLHSGWMHDIMRDECLDAMVQHNLGFIRDVCKVIKHKEHFIDACQYCVEGVIRAIEKWEPERGLRFSTYAHPWIYQKLRRYQSNQLKTIRIAEHAVIKWHKLRRFYALLEIELGRPPTDEELSFKSGMTIDTIESCRTAHGLEPVSMHHGIQGTDLALYESAVFGSTPSAEDEYLATEEAGTALDYLSRLDDQTRQMVVLHLGLDGRVPQTIHMVASRYRLPAVVVKQRLTEAIGELRKQIEAS